MPLSLSSNYTAMKNGGLTIPFQASGGTEPYVYSVNVGGVGGTISSTGIYTSPIGSFGNDVVKVTDALLAESTKTIRVLPPIGLLADILQNQLNLDDDQVWIFNQKINQPKNYDLFLVLNEISCKPFSNVSRETDGQTKSFTNFLSMIDINIQSRGPSAMYRKEEVILALMSVYSRQQQELNSFSIGRISTNFISLSNLDGSAIPYRYVISMMMQYAVSSTKNVEFYNDFPDVELLIDNNQGSASVNPGFLLLEDFEELEL